MDPVRSLLAPITCAAALGCAPASDLDLAEEATEAQDDAVYAASKSLWKTKTIRVCWQNGSVANETERGWVRDAVAGSWEAVSTIDFVGWEACGSQDGSSIRIQIADAGPHVKALGSNLAGRWDGMVLNFTFQNWSPSCKNNREYCIRTIAIHEFGHAIGFAHEQNRPDTPTWCDAEQGSSGDVVVGTWDEDSVMNYCNPHWNGAGVLSEKDVFAMQLLYGDAGLGGFIVNDRSDKCLDVEGASFEPGAAVVSYPCHGDSNQRWSRTSAGGGATWLHVRHSNQCLAVEGGSTQNGARVVQVPCEHDGAHQWKVPSTGRGAIVNKKSGKCLDLAGSSAADGAGLVQWDCHGGENQRFSVH